MHPLDPNRDEPFNCPLCGGRTWAAPLVNWLRCRFCGNKWKVR